MEEITWSLVRIFEALFSGSSSTRPSRLPKMLWPTQLRIFQLRRANIGANTVLRRVSPVLPALPPVTPLRCGARTQDGSRTHVFGPGVEVGQAGVDQAGVENVRALMQFPDGLAVAGTADVMAADHETVERMEIDVIEQRQCRYQRGVVAQPTA